MNSIDYYNINADAFYQRTIGLDMSFAHEKFLFYLPHRAKILDVGCGIGRDSQHFHGLGHDVVAFDASIEMVKKSSELLGYPTLHLTFQDMDFGPEFDGVWASASLLHVSYENMRDIFTKIHQALKPNGIFYVSYKYGNQKMMDGDRAFYNMDEKTIIPYWEPFFETLEFWQVQARPTDTRPDRNWLHCLGRKKEYP